MNIVTITLTSKGQITIPRSFWEDLFRNRPEVDRVLSINDMDRAIALAVGGEDDPQQTPIAEQAFLDAIASGGGG